MPLLGAMKYTVAVLLAVPLGCFLFLYFSYLEENITEGKAYGFIIGTTKQVVFDAVKTTFANDKLYIIYPNSSGSISSIERLDFSPENLKKMKEIDYWRIYLNSKDSHSSISLSFKKNRLIKINRHRQYFELP